MKILTEIEQYKTRADEVYKQYQFQQNFAEKLNKKSVNYANRWFKNSGKSRVYKWRSEEASNIAKSLYDYSVFLRNHANQLELK